MDWDRAEFDPVGLFPPALGWALALAFLAGVVVVVRRRDGRGLAGGWVAAAGAGVALALWLRWPIDWNPALELADTVARVALPTGACTLGVASLRAWRPAAGAVAMSVAGAAGFLSGMALAELAAAGVAMAL
jgi:hypothetical protein